MTKLEQRQETQQSIFPVGFHEYLPHFSTRLATALTKPPVGLLYEKKTGWNPAFLQTIDKVDEVCRQQEICSHGLNNHLLFVAQNAFALSDAINPNQRPGVLDDGNLAFVAFIHDLGYAHEDIIWQGKDAHLHEVKSAQWVDTHRGAQSKGTIDLHLTHFDNHAQLFLTSITSNTDYEHDISRLEPKDTAHPTPQELFLLTFSLADKLDFFRSSRLEGLQKPSSYQQNPYFFLADAVGQYTITSDETHLYYTVTMKNPTPLRRGSSQGMNFDIWKSHVQEEYGWIFQLANLFAQAVGKEFVLQEATD